MRRCLFCLIMSFVSVPTFGQVPKVITNSIGMKLVLIPKGTFMMGSPKSEMRLSVETQHEVTITEGFYIGVTEITQAQYQKVIGNNPSYFQGDKVAERHPETGKVVNEVDSFNHPVERVSWADAVEFCQRLSALPEEKAAGRVYRLPTEAE
jgi:formylglycine-generating enzyme required for sulfatase activity